MNRRVSHRHRSSFPRVNYEECKAYTAKHSYRNKYTQVARIKSSLEYSGTADDGASTRIFFFAL